MPKKNATLFITFPGTAQEAIEYYQTIFQDCQIINITKITDPQFGEVGKLLNGTLILNGLEILVLDLEDKYHPGFTSAHSILVSCENSSEFYKYFDQLKTDGEVLMGPVEMMNYENVTWVTDKYGITWQLVNEK